jgi:toxin ParE1/3/4
VNRLSILPKAVADIDQLSEYISRNSIDAGERFQKAVRRGFQKLLECPDAGTIIRSEKAKRRQIRVYNVPGFRNHLIFYRQIPDALEIVRVIHGARNWQFKVDD